MSRTQKVDIDRDKVRTEARKLDGTGPRVWLDRAIDLAGLLLVQLGEGDARAGGVPALTLDRADLPLLSHNLPADFAALRKLMMG